jgi:hypothetical protein
MLLLVILLILLFGGGGFYGYRSGLWSERNQSSWSGTSLVIYFETDNRR